MNKKIWNGVKIILVLILVIFIFAFFVSLKMQEGSGFKREYQINKPIPNDVLTIKQLKEVAIVYIKKYMGEEIFSSVFSTGTSYSDDYKHLSVTCASDDAIFGLDSVFTIVEIFFNLETGEITYAKKYSGHGFGYISKSDNWNSFYKEFEGKYQDPGEMTIEEFLSYGE